VQYDQGKEMLLRVMFACIITLAVMLLGYPAAFVATHGWAAEAWPGVVGTPYAWLSALQRVDVLVLLGAYLHMVTGTSDAFAGGGQLEGAIICAVIVLCWVLIIGSGPRPNGRRNGGRYGNSRWANRAELGRLKGGVEIGADPENGRAVRIAIEGNLVTIAPPRTGKTSGCVLPNLAACDGDAWAGPVVVIDPKAHAFIASRIRRMILGRTVRCIDVCDVAGGADFWNPMSGIKTSDVLELQALAGRLLPKSATVSDNGGYFLSRATDLLVGGMIAAIHEGKAHLLAVSELLLDRERLSNALTAVGGSAAKAALQILNMEERGRDNIVSTAQTALQFLLDPRMQTMVQKSTFAMDELADGNSDLFIVLPADSRKEVIAPYVRCVLAGLFTMARKHRLQHRLLALIDEAYIFGAFSEFLSGVGELPGFGISIWSFWQSRQQIVELFGSDGAEIFLATAEVVTLFNLAAVQPDEVERWSRALGSFTADKENWSDGGGGGKSTKTTTAEEQRLVPSSDLPALLNTFQVAFVNSARVTGYPMKLAKTLAHTDSRFQDLLDFVAPIGVGA
jgi:type IV secretion system protein VirD4